MIVVRQAGYIILGFCVLRDQKGDFRIWHFVITLTEHLHALPGVIDSVRPPNLLILKAGDEVRESCFYTLQL